MPTNIWILALALCGQVSPPQEPANLPGIRTGEILDRLHIPHPLYPGYWSRQPDLAVPDPPGLRPSNQFYYDNGYQQNSNNRHQPAASIWNTPKWESPREIGEQRAHQTAIDAYTAIIDNTANSSDIRQEARKNRGAAYLARGTMDDLNKALIDYRAAGEKGIVLTVQTATADVRAQPDKYIGKLKKNQTVLVTSIVNDWLWVASVDGSDALKGYIKASAVSEQAAVPDPNSYRATPAYSGVPPRIWNSPQPVRQNRANGTLK